MSSPRIAAIEAGGTKFNLIAASSIDDASTKPLTVVATSDPAETWEAARAWLRREHLHAPFTAVGVGSFGPLDLVAEHIGAHTPKVAWRNFSWRDALAEALDGVPLVLTTDTNAAAWAEYATRPDHAHESLAYVTVGTGIGGGLVLDGSLAGARAHPELGHQRVTRHPSDAFDGVCPSHGDCLEGLASGPAIAARWGQPAPELPVTHPAWELEAYYLGQGLATIAYVTRAATIVLGGGVSRAPGLLERVHLEFDRVVAGYLDNGRDVVRGAHVIVPPRLGDRAGVVGAYLLAGGR